MRQPDKGFRFSVDALLLASYVPPGKWKRALDLGTGCGAVALGLLLRHGEDKWVTAVDMLPEMLECAAGNAKLLGFQDRMTVRGVDVTDRTALREALGTQSVDIVLANPPYRATGHGRVSQGAARASARFEIRAGLAEFCAAAAFCLKNKGRLYLVYLAERMAEAISCLVSHGLEPKRLRPVYGSMGQDARLLLLEACKQGRPGLTLESPLILYQGEGAERSCTAEALRFCPFLACNAGAVDDRSGDWGR